MNVLITRPRGQSAPLEQLLKQDGHQSSHLPLLDIEPLPLSPEMRQWLLDLDQFHGVIVISPSAAHLGLEAIDSLWPQLPIDQDWYANGRGTAHILEAAGIQVTTPLSGTTTEDLLNLPGLQDVAGQRWLIIGGEGGRTLLFDSLTARGAQVIKWPAYRRHCPDVAPDAFAQLMAPIEVITLSSSEALENLHRIAASTKMDLDTLFTKALVVSSIRLQGIAHELGWPRVVLAQGASNQQIADAVRQYTQSMG